MLLLSVYVFFKKFLQKYEIFFVFSLQKYKKYDMIDTMLQMCKNVVSAYGRYDMKNKWLIPVVLFVVLLICYVARLFFESRITVEMLQTDKIEESVSTQGVLIKSESVNSISVAGATEISVKNGQRVSNKELIATVYSGTTDESLKLKLADINKRINAIKGSNSGDTVFINDAAKIEHEIAGCVDEIIADVAKKDMEAISEYKYRLSTLADQKAVAKNEKSGYSNDLVKLQSEKSILEAQLGKITGVAIADRPGIFVEGTDGFETTLTPDAITTLTPDTIRDVINKDKNGEVFHQEEGTYTYKIIDNYSYFLSLNIGEPLINELQVGDSVKLRFLDFAAKDCPATVRFISEPDKDNLRAVVVECNMYVGGLLSKRVVNVDFVKKSATGYKVKVKNIHTVDNAVGIFIKRGAVMKFIPVTIIYSTEDDAVVAAASDDKPIKSYDEIVTSAPEYSDGKVIVSQ